MSQVPGHVEKPHNGRRLPQNDGPIANPPSSIMKSSKPSAEPHPLKAGAVVYPDNDGRTVLAEAHTGFGTKRGDLFLTHPVLCCVDRAKLHP